MSNRQNVKEKRNRKRRSKETGKGKGKGKVKGKEKYEEKGVGENKLQVGTNVMTAIVAEDGTIGTERPVEENGTTTNRDAKGNEGKAAW